MHTYQQNDVFLDNNMKLCKTIEIYLKYDNIHTIVIINGFIYINNNLNSCIKCMLSMNRESDVSTH